MNILQRIFMAKPKIDETAALRKQMAELQAELNRIKEQSNLLTEKKETIVTTDGSGPYQHGPAVAGDPLTIDPPAIILQNNLPPSPINTPVVYLNPKFEKLKPLVKAPISSLLAPTPICAVCGEDIQDTSDTKWAGVGGEQQLVHSQRRNKFMQCDKEEKE